MTLEAIFLVFGLNVVLSLVRFGLRVLAVALEASAAVLVLVARGVGAALAVIAPPLARALTHAVGRLGRYVVRLGRERLGPAVVAGCVWLGERVFDAAGAARRTARPLVRRLHGLVHRTAPRRAPGGRARDAG